MEWQLALLGDALGLVRVHLLHLFVWRHLNLLLRSLGVITDLPRRLYRIGLELVPCRFLLGPRVVFPLCRLHRRILACRAKQVF
jgi:hypothetical protein